MLIRLEQEDDRFNIKSEYEILNEVFMLKELKPSALSGMEGIIQFHEAFNQV